MRNHTSHCALFSGCLLMSAWCGDTELVARDIGATLTGTVTIDGGTPQFSEDMPLILMLAGVKPGSGGLSDIIREGGKFEMPAVAPGTYYLYYPGPLPPANAPKLKKLKEIGVRVVVGDGDKDIGKVNLKSGVATVKLTGTVSADGMTPMFDEDSPQMISLVPAKKGEQAIFWDTPLKKDSKFVIAGIPAGKYLMYWKGATRSRDPPALKVIKAIGVEVVVKKENKGRSQDLGKVALKSLKSNNDGE